MSAATKHTGVTQLEGALCVDMVFYCPVKDAKRWGQLKDTKPDKDNLEKAVLDVMESAGLFAVGDSQVAAGEVVKLWCAPAEAGCFVSVSMIRTKKSPQQGAEGSPDWLA